MFKRYLRIKFLSRSGHTRKSLKKTKQFNTLFISVIDQLVAQNFCFTIRLFHACTCFEHSSHHQEVKIALHSLWYHHNYRLQPATRIPPQPSHTETPTHIETRTHDQCGDTIEKSQAPDDGYINDRNMLSIEDVK